MSITIKNLQAFTEAVSEAYWEEINHEFTFKDSDDQEYTFKVLETKKVYLDDEEAEKGYYRDITLECNNKKYTFSYEEYDGYYDGYFDNLEEIKPKVESRWQKPFDELKSFLEANPELRFWQALWAVTGTSIMIDGEDPFNWEGLVNPKK